MDELELTNELRILGEMLGDTRARFHRRQTPFAASEQLIEIDREIRESRAKPHSAGLLAEVRRLAARLRALDPH